MSTKYITYTGWHFWIKKFTWSSSKQKGHKSQPLTFLPIISSVLTRGGQRVSPVSRGTYEGSPFPFKTLKHPVCHIQAVQFLYRFINCWIALISAYLGSFSIHYRFPSLIQTQWSEIIHESTVSLHNLAISVSLQPFVW